MCCGTAGVRAYVVIWECWDEIVEVVIVDYPDGDTRVTVVGVVLLVWKLTVYSEGCHMEDQMVRCWARLVLPRQMVP